MQLVAHTHKTHRQDEQNVFLALTGKRSGQRYAIHHGTRHGSNPEACIPENDWKRVQGSGSWAHQATSKQVEHKRKSKMMRERESKGGREEERGEETELADNKPGPLFSPTR